MDGATGKERQRYPMPLHGYIMAVCVSLSPSGAVNALISQLRKEEEKVQVDLVAGISVSRHLPLNVSF